MASIALSKGREHCIRPLRHLRSRQHRLTAPAPVFIADRGPECPRIVYQLVHEARTSVHTFHQWWFNSAGEEAEEEKAVMLGAEGPFWTAISDEDLADIRFWDLPTNFDKVFVACGKPNRGPD
jgi:hypothetical protein